MLQLRDSLARNCVIVAIVERCAEMDPSNPASEKLIPTPPIRAYVLISHLSAMKPIRTQLGQLHTFLFLSYGCGILARLHAAYIQDLQ
jgi:hypothetical protein